MRAFVALELPPAMRDRIAALCASLQPKLPGVRWLAPATFHLTLRFLGEVTAAQVESLRRPLEAAAAACLAQTITVRDLGLFPERGAPQVLWLDSALPDPLAELQRACEAAAIGCGIAPERRPFRSHITLGRWRDRVRRPELPPADLGPTPVDSLVLFESRLDPQGALHSPLAAFPLGGGGLNSAR